MPARRFSGEYTITSPKGKYHGSVRINITAPLPQYNENYRRENYLIISCVFVMICLKRTSMADSVLRGKSKEIAKQIVVLCREIERETFAEYKKRKSMMI